MGSNEVEATFEFLPTEAEEGNYTCIATNDLGVAMTTLTVDVRSEFHIITVVPQGMCVSVCLCFCGVVCLCVCVCV